MSKEYGKLSTIFYELTKPLGNSIEGPREYYTKQLEGISGFVLESGAGSGTITLIVNN